MEISRKKVKRGLRAKSFDTLIARVEPREKYWFSVSAALNLSPSRVYQKNYKNFNANSSKWGRCGWFYLHWNLEGTYNSNSRKSTSETNRKNQDCSNSKWSCNKFLFNLLLALKKFVAKFSPRKKRRAWLRKMIKAYFGTRCLYVLPNVRYLRLKTEYRGSFKIKFMGLKDERFNSTFQPPYKALFVILRLSTFYF